MKISSSEDALRLLAFSMLSHFPLITCLLLYLSMADPDEGLDLENFLGAAHSALPLAAQELGYVQEKNIWGIMSKFPKDLKAKATTAYSYIIEKAKSGISGCRRCGEKIPKSSLRFGYLTPDPRGDYGCIALFFHPYCIPLPFLKVDSLADLFNRCQGFAELYSEEQNDLLQVKLDDPEKLTVYDMKDLVKRVLTERLPAPRDLLVELLPFQAEGYAWMVNQELGTTRGGILADEMGMGKTLQAISLILGRKDKVRPTLAVVPVAAVIQWHNEIIKFTGPDTLKVHVYHSTSKLPAKELAQFDIVITTYQTLELDYRKQANKTKLSCPYCSKLFMKSKLRLHLKYFCGPEAERTAKQKLTARSQATKKGLRTLGIGVDEYEPPTITNIFKDMVNAGAADSSESEPAPKRARNPKKQVTPESSSKRVKVSKEVASSESEDDPQPKRARNPKKQESPQQRPKRVAAKANVKNDISSESEDSDLQSKKLPELRKIFAQLDEGETKQKPKTRVEFISAINRLKRGGESEDESEYISSDDSNDSSAVITDVSSSDDESDDESDDGSGDGSDDSIGSSILDGVDTAVDLSNSPLHAVKWGRVILDEAHRVKQRTNSTATAAFSLDATYRWCLSGTPLQNRVGELHSLLRFLRFSPFAYYNCKAKGCDCKSLDYVFVDNKYCVGCNHTKMQHYSYFNQMVSNPIKKYGVIGLGAEAFRTLRTLVLDKVLLRRTKDERKADLNLPPMEITQRSQEPGAAEKDFYTAIYTDSQLQYSAFADKGTLLHNYAHIFDLLTKLRQACDHPWLLTRRGALPQVEESEFVCGCCHEDIGPSEGKGVSACSHSFHKVCLEQYIDAAPVLPAGGGGIGCPTCFAFLSVTYEEPDEDDTRDCTPEGTPKPSIALKKNSILTGVSNSNFVTSTKLEMLADEIRMMQVGDKALVFSQFTRMLELAEFRLKQDNVECARLTGAQSMKHRSNVILSFHRDPNLRVLLISLKAGGEGVNLQVANHIFLLDPWWNPASELQAIQRAHRIGQTKPVKATRLILKGTVEEKVISLQEKKQLVFDGTIGQSDSALQQLTSADLAFLFVS